MNSLIPSSQQSIKTTITTQLITALENALQKSIKANPYTA